MHISETPVKGQYIRCYPDIPAVVGDPRDPRCWDKEQHTIYWIEGQAACVEENGQVMYRTH